MPKAKKRLTPAQKRARKAARAERRRKYEWVFINGKQVKINRAPTIDGKPVDQFIEENAGPIWLHQEGLWELMPAEETFLEAEPEPSAASDATDEENEDEIPF